MKCFPSHGWRGLMCATTCVVVVSWRHCAEGGGGGGGVGV